MGVYTGEPVCTENPITGCTDYCGPELTSVASIRSAAHGGQIILSHSTWVEVEAYLDALAENEQPQAVYLGEFWVQGLNAKEPLIEVKPSGLQMRSFPPPFSQIGESPTKEALARMSALAQVNERLSSTLSALTTQLEALARQSKLLKENLGGIAPFCDFCWLLYFIVVLLP